MRPGGNPNFAFLRNTDTAKANGTRQTLADEHIRKLLPVLYEMVVEEQVDDWGERVDWLNSRGHYTRRGNSWSKVTLKRLFTRLKARGIKP